MTLNKNYKSLIIDKKIDVKVKFFKNSRGLKYELIQPISKKPIKQNQIKTKLNST